MAFRSGILLVVLHISIPAMIQQGSSGLRVWDASLILGWLTDCLSPLSPPGYLDVSYKLNSLKGVL